MNNQKHSHKQSAKFNKTILFFVFALILLEAYILVQSINLQDLLLNRSIVTQENTIEQAVYLNRLILAVDNFLLYHAAHETDAATLPEKVQRARSIGGHYAVIHQTSQKTIDHLQPLDPLSVADNIIENEKKLERIMQSIKLETSTIINEESIAHNKLHIQTLAKMTSNSR